MRSDGSALPTPHIQRTIDFRITLKRTAGLQLQSRNHTGITLRSTHYATVLPDCAAGFSPFDMVLASSASQTILGSLPIEILAKTIPGPRRLTQDLVLLHICQHRRTIYNMNLLATHSAWDAFHTFRRSAAQKRLRLSLSLRGCSHGHLPQHEPTRLHLRVPMSAHHLDREAASTAAFVAVFSVDSLSS